MEATLITLDTLLSDMEAELRTDMNTNIPLYQEFEPSQQGDGDEIFLSANTDVRNSLNEISQNSQNGDGDEIFLSANTETRHSLDTINSNNQNIDDNEILPHKNENSSFKRSNENAYLIDSDEIFLSIPIDEQSERKEPNLSLKAESGEKNTSTF
jgi:hypothetical protein